MTIAAKGAVRKVVVSTLERIGRGSCAEIERRGAHVQVAQCVSLRSGAVMPLGPVGKWPVGRGLV